MRSTGFEECVFVINPNISDQSIPLLAIDLFESSHAAIIPTVVHPSLREFKLKYLK
jgi:hypothetical protein